MLTERPLLTCTHARTCACGSSDRTREREGGREGGREREREREREKERERHGDRVSVCVCLKERERERERDRERERERDREVCMRKPCRATALGSRLILAEVLAYQQSIRTLYGREGRLILADRGQTDTSGQRAD